MQAFLEGGIIPFAADQAQVAARLFNAAERPRRLQVDAMIAATAISRQAALAAATEVLLARRKTSRSKSVFDERSWHGINFYHEDRQHC